MTRSNSVVYTDARIYAALAAEGRTMSIPELARLTHMSIGGVHRALVRLHAAGRIVRHWHSSGYRGAEVKET